MVSASVVRDTGILEESYTYDYLGNRTSKTSDGKTTYFTTDLSSGYSQVLKEVNDDETVYYTRGFELISRRTGSEASYYLFDGGMSVRGITDEEGNLTDTLVFDAFGNEVERTGTTENSYGFQGEEHDETGLYYLRARYMDPTTGTFTSMDTYGGSLSEPMSLHKYLFANSNPVKWCDPSGHDCTLLDEMVACGIVTMVSNALFYWIDIGINPEGEYDDMEYIFILFSSFCMGAFSVGLLGLFSGISLLTVVGIELFLIAILMAIFGLMFKTILNSVKENTESQTVNDICVMLDVLSDLFVVPFNNIITFGNDICGLILDFLYFIGGEIFG